MINSKSQDYQGMIPSILTPVEQPYHQNYTQIHCSPIDMLLEPQEMPIIQIRYGNSKGQSATTTDNENNLSQLTTIQGSTPNIFLFPAKRVRVINDRRGHNRLAQLLDDIKEVVATKIKRTGSISLATVFHEQGLESGHYFPCRDILDGHIQGRCEYSRLCYVIIYLINHYSLL